MVSIVDKIVDCEPSHGRIGGPQSLLVRDQMTPYPVEAIRTSAHWISLAYSRCRATESDIHQTLRMIPGYGR